MIAVIFEVRPATGREAAYLDIAASLRVELEAIPGFVSVERFQSLTEPGKLLSQPRPSPRRTGCGPRRRLRRLSPADRGGDARLWHDAARRGAGGQPCRAWITGFAMEDFACLAQWAAAMAALRSLTLADRAK
jgi:hypothetical protein